jgi:steroid delta-isomerase-like uncharacterized protein
LPWTRNRESVEIFFERVLNAGDLTNLESLSHQDVIIPESAPGIENLRRFLQDLRTTFANPEYKVIDTISEGEKVVVRFSVKATHAGRFLGIPPSGRKLKIWGVMIFRFEAGAIAELWTVLDAQGILKQLRGP